MPGLRLDVTAFPECVGPARAEVSTWADAAAPHLKSDLVLAVSEAIANSVRHGPDGGRIRVTLAEDDDGVRVEVRDEGLPQTIALRPPDDSSGRGLHIVDALARRWGVTNDPTCVWFVLAA